MPDRRRARPAGIAWVIAPAAALVMGLAGCATQASQRQADLTALKLVLPGSYGPPQATSGTGASTRDVATAAGAVNPAHARLAVNLSIVPVESANVIGDSVYYVRETAADNDRLVLAENIWTLAIDPREGIVQQNFMFKDPRRWLGVAQDPSLLVALLPSDLLAMPGCELVWTRTPSGFEARALSDSCRPGRAAAGLWIERRARLSAGRLSLSERYCGPDGALETHGTPMTLTLTHTADARQR